jgi:hypothetical protein
MFLVLAHADDRPALRVRAALVRRHGAASVALVSADALALAPVWEHRLWDGEDDDTLRSVIGLPDGRTLEDATVGVVFNRLRRIEAPHFARAKPADRDYAGAELYSLALSWLASLRAPVVNPVSTRALFGPERSAVEWLCAFAEAGLAPRGLAMRTSARDGPPRGDWWACRVAPESTNSLVPAGEPMPASLLGRRPAIYLEPVAAPAGRARVVGDRGLGDAPEETHGGTLRLARRLGCDLLEVDFGRTPSGGLRAATATVCPGLHGEPEVLAVADLLEARRVRPPAAP